MVNATFSMPPTLSDFAVRFASVCSSRLRPTFLRYLAALFLEFKRFNLQAASTKVPLGSYESLQYFLSEAKWNPDDLNQQRLRLIQSRHHRRSLREGVLVLDDTACKKPYALHTDAAAPQYVAGEDHPVNAHVTVFSAFAHPQRKFPVSFKLYLPAESLPLGTADPQFKTKIELAKTTVKEAIASKITFSDVVFDSWYFSEDFVSFLESPAQNLTWITEAKADRLISFRGAWVHADDLDKVIPRDKFRCAVTVPNASGKPRVFLTYAFLAKVKGLRGKKKIVVAIGSWDRRDQRNVHIFITNRLALSAHEILHRFALRWKIEELFRELKDFLYFDHYQVRSQRAIVRHWHLVLLAHTYLYLHAPHQPTVGGKPLSPIGLALRFQRAYNDQAALHWFRKNPRLASLFALTEPLAAA
jgi:SRSO17 transposase